MSESGIFKAAVKLPPERRAAYLDQACGSDAELRAEIESLLHAHDATGGFLEDVPAGPDPTEDYQPIAERPGTVIGPYKLMEQIGEGGFGLVFVAEQQQPIRRKVALKIIKPGMDTREIIARFEAERQALALMDHANIARVFDAGMTSSGRPYFVMELVRGFPIVDYCDSRQLTTRDRLELFLSVCQAVQHAHSKGIIHRDLKPSNILVAPHDGVPVVKVIDFGVAKAIGQQLTDKTIYTRFAQMIGTPLYMSPEQVEINALDVDIRSDVYSLGVLLYELLTGTTPFDRQRLATASFDEMRRIIKEEEPPRPSMRLSSARDAAKIAGARQTETAKLAKLVHGELDWIVMKALEKDRNRRYETANSLAMDVQRYLVDEPVLARAPSAAYRFHKFARRNRVSLAASTAVLAITVVGLAASTLVIAQERDAAREAATRERLAAKAADAHRAAAVQLADEAERQRADADRERQRAETNFRRAREAVDRVFTLAAEKMANEPHMEQIRRALLEDALEFYQGFLKQKGTDPIIRLETARAYLRVGRIHELLGRIQQAESPMRQAIELLQHLAADYPFVPEYRSDLADAHDNLSAIYGDHLLARPADTMEHRRAALAITSQLAADFPNRPGIRKKLASRLTGVGIGYTMDLSNPKKGGEYFRPALAAWQDVEKEAPNDPGVIGGRAWTQWWLGVALMNGDRLQEAEPELRGALALREKLLQGRPTDFGLLAVHAHNKSHLGHLLTKTGRPAEAEPLLREAVAFRRRMIQDYPDSYEHWRRLVLEQDLLSDCLVVLKRLQEAELLFRQRLAIVQQMVARFPEANRHSYGLGWTYYALGLILQDTGRPQDAAEAFRESKKQFEAAMAKDPGASFAGNRAHALAWFLVDCPAIQFRDPARAVELAKQTLQFAPQSGRYWFTLGLAQYRAAQPRDAIASLHKSKDLLSGGDSRHWFFLSMAHWQTGDKDEARKWYDRAVKWQEKNQPTDDELRRFRAEAEELMGKAVGKT